MATATRVLPPPPFVPQPPVDEGFGPDASTTPKDPPKVNQKNPPKPSPLTKLGSNKKLRSPVRKLSREAAKENEQSDWERLAGWYLRIAKIVGPFRPVLGQAIVEQTEDCVNSWFDLAENNDTVRRWILGIIEGGDWGKVIAAHTPLFMAVIPEKALERIMLKGMGMFSAFAQTDNEMEEMAESLRQNGYVPQ